ncbi:MAG: universal stress protein [Chloroflexota bacterium]
MRIGIAVDGSSPAIAGVEFVASLPLSGRDQVTVVSVAETPVMLSAMPFTHVDSVADSMDELYEMSSERAHNVAENAAERLIGLPCPVTSVVSSGHPIEILEGFAADASLDLLVLGPRGRGSIGSILLGSVSQALLHAMPTSILVARPPVHAPRRVLLAIDGSPQSLDAARFLAAFPLPAEADIRVVVSVTSWTEQYGLLRAANYLERLAAERTHAGELAQQAIDIFTAHGRHATPMIRDGDPKREILDAAREIDADLIVTGARGIGGFRSLVLGSVSRGVSKAASCSTLVVAHGRAERE